MTNRQLQERRRRRRRIRRIRMAIKIAVYSLMVLLVVGAVWFIGSKIKNKDDKNPDSQQPIQEADLSVDNQENDNQTDDAAVSDTEKDSDVSEVISAVYDGTEGRPGWNVDDQGWWYLKEDKSMYTNSWQTIDGKDFYFDENGYMATGWKQIDGQYYYFKADGQVQQDATQKLVALTYDDGPSSFTDRLLDCLEANGAKATFFVVGEQAERFPESVQREDSLGMEIGSHTYNHPYMSQLDAAGLQETLSKNETVLTSIIGHGTTILRPTGGALNDLIRANTNSPLIIWDVDTLDWKTKNVDSILSEIRSQVKDGSVVLMHDLYESTVAASEIIIPELIEQGYRLVTVSELAELRGVEMKAGHDYESFYLPEPESTESDDVQTGGNEA